MKLPAWLISVGKTPDWLAEQLEVDVITVYRYLNGTRMPQRDVMVRIVVVTEWKVTPNDFYELPPRPKRRRRPRRATTEPVGSRVSL